MGQGYDFGAAPGVKVLNIGKFSGVDFASNPAAVADNRSPNAKNILSDLAGKPVKRTGYETLGTFDGRINGIYRLATANTEKILVHAGKKLYEWVFAAGKPTVTKRLLYQDMADDRSTAFQANKRLWFLDGKTYLVYGDFSANEDGSGWAVKKVTDIAYVPMVVVGRDPAGTGGATKEDTNMLTRWRVYSFFGTKDPTAKAYHLSSTDDVKLNADPVKVRILNSNGVWVDKSEGTDFSVNRTKGIVTFNVAPGTSPSTLDNVEIEVSVALDDEIKDDPISLINGCRIAALYGMDGAMNMAFVSGNAKVPNFQYWTGASDDYATDPSYFPGFNYQYIGQDSTAIMGYSTIGNYLAVHKEANGQDENIFLIGGQTDEAGNVSFPIVGTAAGIGAVSRYAFARLDTEPLFLSSQGVCAVTTQDYTARRYAQDRSYYINPRLVDEPNLADAVATVFNNRYWLAVNGHVYVADGRQKGYQKNAPMSEFQYEWYYLDNIPARVWWQYDGHLWFGDGDGKVRRFWLASEDSAVCRVYNDDGAAIEAIWDTPIFTFDTISQYKTMKGLWVMTAPYLRSGMGIYYRHSGLSVLVRSSKLDIFDFGDVDFNRLTFYTDDSPRIVATNTKLKKFMTAQFRFQNGELNDAFGFYEAEMQYTVGGRYKG